MQTKAVQNVGKATANCRRKQCLTSCKEKILRRGAHSETRTHQKTGVAYQSEGTGLQLKALGCSWDALDKGLDTGHKIQWDGKALGCTGCSRKQLGCTGSGRQWDVLDVLSCTGGTGLHWMLKEAAGMHWIGSTGGTGLQLGWGHWTRGWTQDALGWEGTGLHWAAGEGGGLRTHECILIKRHWVAVKVTGLHWTRDWTWDMGCAGCTGLQMKGTGSHWILLL
eukprot:1141416-Pelagomonas_calceolata.AAC.4